MNLRSDLHSFLQFSPIMNTSSERTSALNLVGFAWLEPKLTPGVQKYVFVDELLKQLASEGQPTLVLFCNRLADSNLYGLDYKEKLRSFASQIGNLNQRGFDTEFRGYGPSSQDVPQPSDSESLSERDIETPIEPPETPESVNRTGFFGELETDLEAILNSILSAFCLILRWLGKGIVSAWKCQEQDSNGKRFLLGLMVFLFIAVSTLVQDFNGRLCQYSIDHYEAEASQMTDDVKRQRKYFKQGLKAYECRNYLATQNDYKSSFDKAAGSRNNENVDVYTLFYSRAINVRDRAWRVSSSDDFEFSIFLLEKGAETLSERSPYLPDLHIELGKTYQAAFELETKGNSSLNDSSTQKAVKLIDNSLSHYQIASNLSAEKASSLIYIGYAKIMYGDFLRKYAPQPSPSNESSNGKFNIEGYRNEEANSQYEEAITYFRNAYQQVLSINPNDVANIADIQDDALLGESITLNRQALLWKDDHYRQNACNVYKYIRRPLGYVKYVESKKLYEKWSSEAPSGCYTN